MATQALGTPHVLLSQSSAPPINLPGPELVRDLVTLIQRAEAGFQARDAELALGQLLEELN
jgi:hypothetical protein